jgi:hypothetical protein
MMRGFVKEWVISEKNMVFTVFCRGWLFPILPRKKDGHISAGSSKKSVYRMNRRRL